MVLKEKQGPNLGRDDPRATQGDWRKTLTSEQARAPGGLRLVSGTYSWAGCPVDEGGCRELWRLRPPAPPGEGAPFLICTEVPRALPVARGQGPPAVPVSLRFILPDVLDVLPLLGQNSILRVCSMACLVRRQLPARKEKAARGRAWRPAPGHADCCENLAFLVCCHAMS